MKRGQVYLLVGLTTMGFQMWSWFLGGLMAVLSLGQLVGGILQKSGAPGWFKHSLGGAGYAAGGPAGKVADRAIEHAATRPEREAERAAGLAERNARLMSYQRSNFMPQGPADYMARYRPSNRDTRSSPDFINYLQQFIKRQ